MSLYPIVISDIREGLLSKRYYAVLIDAECSDNPNSYPSADGENIVAVVTDGYIHYYNSYHIFRVINHVDKRTKFIYIVTPKMFMKFLKESRAMEFFNLFIKYIEIEAPEHLEEVKRDLSNMQGVYIASPQTVKEMFGADAKTCRILPLTREYMAKMIEGFIDMIEMLIFKR